MKSPLAQHHEAITRAKGAPPLFSRFCMVRPQGEQSMCKMVTHLISSHLRSKASFSRIL